MNRNLFALNVLVLLSWIWLVLMPDGNMPLVVQILGIIAPILMVLAATGDAYGYKWARTAVVVTAVVSVAVWAVPGFVIGAIAAFIAGGVEGSRSAQPTDIICPAIGVLLSALLGLAVNIRLVRSMPKPRR